MADNTNTAFPKPSPETQAAVAQRIRELENEGMDIGIQFRVHSKTGEPLSPRTAEVIVELVAEREIQLGIGEAPNADPVQQVTQERLAEGQMRLDNEAINRDPELKRRVSAFQDSGIGELLHGGIGALLDPKTPFTAEERRTAIVNHVLSFIATRDVLLEER